MSAAVAWMLVSGLCFAASGAFAKAASADYGPVELMLYRCAFIVLAIAVYARAAGLVLRTRLWGAHFARSAAGVSSLLFFLYCLSQAPLSTAVTLNYTSPLFLALITGLVLREHVPPLAVAAIVLGFVGVVVLLQPGGAEVPLLAGLSGLAGGAVSALAYLGIRRLGAAGEPEWRTVFYFALLGLLTGLPALPWLGASLPPLADLPLLLAVGASALGAQLAMTAAYARGPTLVAATLSYSGVLFAALIDVVLWRQVPAASGWIGMIAIVAAGVMTVLARRPAAPPRR
ncbi:MAG: DMT family transporter [Pseudomonadota bacterium]|jgi:S-adenosylmethionine uptake transporter